MNTSDDFTNIGNSLIVWLSNYFKNIESFPVKPNLQPGDIEKQLPNTPSIQPEAMETIIDDFNSIIFPGITHWQHPGFHAYFPANNSFPSIFAEILVAGLGVQGMKWVTSPAATELERVMMMWLQKMIGLPDKYKGVITDTASVATLCAILAARERISGFNINSKGFEGKCLRVYCSTEAHSSIEKAVRIAGIGSDNLIKIPIDENLKMISLELDRQIKLDIDAGFVPTCVIGALGTTGTCAVDPLDELAEIANKYNIWYHIDAAYAGNALILPEYRNSIPDYSKADSIVFNPHKWLFVNFDCSAFFVRNPSDLTRTFSLIPEYLKTEQDEEIDYSNWGIQLGRRFRSLKLWFVIRSFGIEGLQNKIKGHLELGRIFEKYVSESNDFELVVPRNLNVICFRYIAAEEYELNKLNEKLLKFVNDSGKVFLSHTLINGTFVIRFVCGQANVEERHILTAWKEILKATEQIRKSI
jgi:aromatic-L-amino-acid/L-tryptophan decarboxylase